MKLDNRLTALLQHEEWEVSLKEISQKYLIRPLQMLLTPICFLVSLYAAFVYGGWPLVVHDAC